MQNQPFVVSLTSEPSYRLGDPVVITFAIENTDSNTYQVLTWGTPLEGDFTVDYLVVRRNGNHIPYDGQLVKRGDPSPEDYVIIQPGERLTRDVDVSEAYAIDEVGDYTVTLNATMFDAFRVPGNNKEAPRKIAAHQSHKLTPVTTQFKVVVGGAPKLTAGEVARKASKLAQRDRTTPTFIGATATEQADTLFAHRNAQYFAARAASQLNAGPASTNALYQTWFGAFDKGRYANVTKHFTDINNTLLSDRVTYDFTGSSCTSSRYAYTFKGSRTIFLCTLYINAPQIGINSKFGTLVHEWSHAVSSTDDNAYGESKCQALAISDPERATNNADNHEYFAEHLALDKRRPMQRIVFGSLEWERVATIQVKDWDRADWQVEIIGMGFNRIKNGTPDWEYASVIPIKHWTGADYLMEIHGDDFAVILNGTLEWQTVRGFEYMDWNGTRMTVEIVQE